MVDARPGMLVGAGTVLTPRQVDEARDAGAAFVVSPGFSEAVVDHCLAHGMPVYPGVCTPTEIEMALGRGLRVVKFFPAEPIGGLPLLKAIAAPYGEMSFMPTGGITRDSVGRWLAFDRVVACGGSWMAPVDWIRGGRFDQVREEAERTVATVRVGGAS
jgi:2-dehydro-3-deoxyphosphogluconate aldolase/(4S)-4-hydroxy-2-oxoglutarate aldolase